MFIVIIYLFIINLIAFIAMGYDKQQARQSKRRLSEKRLFTYAFIGGAVGSWIGMQVWRHKTKHTSFVIGMPLLIIINVACIYLVWWLVYRQIP